MPPVKALKMRTYRKHFNKSQSSLQFKSKREENDANSRFEEDRKEGEKGQISPNHSLAQVLKVVLYKG